MVKVSFVFFVMKKLTEMLSQQVLESGTPSCHV